MFFYGDLSNKPLSELLSSELGVGVQYPDVHIFPDGEKRVRIHEELVDQEIIILKSFANPVDANLTEFLFLVDALKRSGAGKVTAIIPYLAYQRADHIFRSGEAVPLKVVISMIESVGVDRVLLLDPHSIKIPDMFSIPTKDVSAISLFSHKIKELDLPLSKISVVSPDMGGIRRVKQMSDALAGVPYVAVNKDRDLETGKVKATHHEGQIREICIIVDDICSTGHTIVRAIDYVHRQGAKKTYVMCTHPVLSEDSPRLLQESKVERVFMTDSIQIPKGKKFKKLEIISVAKLLSHNLNSI